MSGESRRRSGSRRTRWRNEIDEEQGHRRYAGLQAGRSEFAGNAVNKPSAVFRGVGYYAFVLLSLVGAAGCREERSSVPTLKLYAESHLRQTVTALIAAFEADTGIVVDADYGVGPLLLEKARSDHNADLFLPGNVWYVNELHRRRGVIESRTAIARSAPALIVSKDTEKVVTSVDDLRQPGLRVGLADSRCCEIGRLTDRVLARTGLVRDALVTRTAPSVAELIRWVRGGEVDVAIVWDTVDRELLASVLMVRIPDPWCETSEVVLGVLTTSKHKDEARRFSEFLAGPKGRQILQANGFQTSAGDDLAGVIP